MQTTADHDGFLDECPPPPLLDTLVPGAPVSVPGDWSDPPLPEDWSDQQLVRRCLAGDEQSWATLINRYKRLIYSFPRRYGAGPSDAADVFQLVCAELFRALPHLRNHGSLRSWIMTVASHQAYQWKRRHVQQAQRECEDGESAADGTASSPSEALEQAERDHVVREAIAQLPPRCRALVRMLFYQDPPLPYQAVAEQLGLATGSIGLTRMRCLKRLERMLADAGVVR